MKNWIFLGFITILLLTARCGQGAALKLAGELSLVRGQVTLLSQGQSQPRPILHFALLQNGDLIALAAGSSAQLRLWDQGATYSLSGGGWVRILKGHQLLRKGSAAHLLISSVIFERLPPELFGRSRESQVVRGDAQWGQEVPSPFFTVRGPGVILRWIGRIKSEDTPPGEWALHLRVQEGGAIRWFFTQNLSPAALSVMIPSGILVPGLWYDWSVQVVGPGGLKIAGGPVRVLPPGDRVALARIENTVAVEFSDSPHPGLARAFLADAYISYGLVEEALLAYQEAERAGGGPDCAAQFQRLETILNR